MKLFGKELLFNNKKVYHENNKPIANDILFNDGQSFQEKLDNGSLKGDKGDIGLQGPIGQKGDTGLTPEEKEFLFQSVSNGKKDIAAAITDKGVETAADASFAQMATNIKAIKTGTELTDIEKRIIMYWRENTDWSYRFKGNIRISDFEDFNTSHVKNMDGMFQDSSIMTVRELNTSSVESMDSMFSGCNELISLTFDSNSTSIANFELYGCERFSADAFINMIYSLPYTSKNVYIGIERDKISSIPYDILKIAIDKGYSLPI